ncbi:MAG: hypothetical protein HBSAPP03_05580 [Phycisphaerae bacterium]|nr:MAG: hypothetical protein HBSAPP03_05580 [Phycisphaerae bacterium]
MSLRSMLVASMVIACAAAPTLAQETAQPAASLKAGSAAPAFKVEKFLKGSPITGFEKGKVYVVEFWATWCGPCVMSMPHLSSLQTQYKDKGVTICGVNIWEDQAINEETLAKVTKFVQDRGDGMAYTVAYDGAAKQMDTTWMQAAGQNGIPSSFVVDGTGTIAWIGHPMELDMVLDEVVKGSWSVTEGPKKLEAAAKAYTDAAEKYKDGLNAGDEAWKKAERDYPILAKSQKVGRFMGMMEGKHYAAASALGNTLVDESVAAKDTMTIMGVLGAFMDPDTRPADFDKALLLKAAKANFDLSPEEFTRHVVMAQVYYTLGDFEQGKASAGKAVELAEDRIKEPLKNWLEQSEAEARKKAAPEGK